MPRNASGDMSLSGQFAVPFAVPASATINSYIDDIVSEISNSLDRDGKATMRAILKMGGYKITGMADGAAATDGASLQQAQAGKIAWSDGGGTVDAITAAYTPAVTALVDGMRLRVRATGANATTTPTFTPNSGPIPAYTIKKLNGQALVAGDIAGDEHDLDLTYVATGTYWNLNNPAKASSISGVAVTATSLSASQDFVLSGVLTPAQITADQNDYAPTGHATASQFRISSNAARSITGLAGGVAGRVVTIINVGSNTITLTGDDAASTAANRFGTPGPNSIILEAGSSCVLQYDGTASRWRLLGNGICRAGSFAMETAISEVVFSTPGQQHRHPGHPKFWAFVTVAGGTPTLQTSYNVTSITDTATGRLTVTIGTDFSSANWAPFVSTERAGTSLASANDTRAANVRSGTIAAGTIEVECMAVGGSPALSDPGSWSVIGLGDQ